MRNKNTQFTEAQLTNKRMKNIQFQKPNTSENKILKWKNSFEAGRYTHMYMYVPI